jgi:hypothetical protein
MAPEYAQEMDVVQMWRRVCESPSCFGAVGVGATAAGAVGVAAVAGGGEEPWSPM